MRQRTCRCTRFGTAASTCEGDRSLGAPFYLTGVAAPLLSVRHRFSASDTRTAYLSQRGSPRLSERRACVRGAMCRVVERGIRLPPHEKRAATRSEARLTGHDVGTRDELCR